MQADPPHTRSTGHGRGLFRGPRNICSPPVRPLSSAKRECDESRKRRRCRDDRLDALIGRIAEVPVVYLGLGGSIVAGLMTGVGALPVLLARGVSRRLQNVLLGFGAGVMLAATAFSLILPGIAAARAQAGTDLAATGIVALGIMIGGICLWLGDYLVTVDDAPQGPYEAAAEAIRGSRLFVIAITLHNFPEGLAVGVGFGSGNIGNGVTLTIGIGLQNMPEGLAVALALLAAGSSRGKAFAVGLASGLVEPVGGLLGAGIVTLAQPALPWALAFAAGAMLFVISQEVIPQIHRERRQSINTFGLLAGFVAMMLLDVIFG